MMLLLQFLAFPFRCKTVPSIALKVHNGRCLFFSQSYQDFSLSGQPYLSFCGALLLLVVSQVLTAHGVVCYDEAMRRGSTASSAFDIA